MSIRRMRLGLLAHLRMGAVISALVSGYAHVGHAQSFSHFYVFGGSFSDAGTYLRGTTAADAVSRRWTVNPAPVWNQLLGQEHGIAVTPYLAINTVDNSSTALGGSNYAQGGARVNSLPGEFPSNTLSLQGQVNTYLTAAGGRANPSALYSLEGGGNDIFFWAQQVQANPLRLPVAIEQIVIAAEDFVRIARQMSNAGARRIIILNVHNPGTTPIGTEAGAAGAIFLTDTARLFNAVLLAGLHEIGTRNFIYVNTFGFFDELIRNGSAYGFSNVTDPACLPGLQAIDCTVATIRPGASPFTYLFSDNVHPTGPGHLALAQYIQSILSAPGLVAMTAEVPIHHGRSVDRALDACLSNRGHDGVRVCGAADASSLELEKLPGAPGGDSRSGGAHFGLDLRSQGLFVGGLLNYAASENKFSVNTGHFVNHGRFDTEMLTGTGYLGIQQGPVLAMLSGTLGIVDYDSITRRFNLYMGHRSNWGSTEGQYHAAQLKTGYDVALGNGTLTALGALSYQRVAVDGYTERQGDFSSMVFGDQTRELLFGTLGAQYTQAHTIGSVNLRGTVRAAYNHDFLNQSREMLAGLLDAAGLQFATPVPNPGRSWWDLNAELIAQFNQHWMVRAAVGSQFSPDNFTNFWGKVGIVVPL